MDEKLFQNVALIITNSKNLQKAMAKSIQIFKEIGERLFVMVPAELEEVILNECGLSKSQIDINHVKFTSIAKGMAVETIAEKCKTESIDLIISRLSNREDELERYYEKSISRQLVKILDCSLLFLKDSDLESGCYSKLAVNDFKHPKAKDTSRMAERVGAILKSANIISIGEIKSENKTDTKANGYRIYDRVKVTGSDLLIMNSPDTKLGYANRVFTNELEYVISEPPCDILLVHSTKNTASYQSV